MRLNGWQRIGIVVSVVWILGISGWLWYSIREEQNVTAEIHLSTCLDLPTSNPDTCQSNWVKEIRTYRRDLCGFDLAFSLVPVLLSWASVYGVLWIVRWVRDGFVSSKSSSKETMTS
jgi:hypothetical protein